MCERDRKGVDERVAIIERNETFHWRLILLLVYHRLLV